MAIGTNAIPFELKSDNNISANAKLIYLEISFCCKKFQVCNFSNNDFQKMLGISNHTLISSLSSLQEKGWIEIEYSRKLGTTSERFIRLKKPQKNSQEVVKKFHRGCEKTSQGVVKKLHKGSEKTSQPPSLLIKENKEINKENKKRGDDYSSSSPSDDGNSNGYSSEELALLFDHFWSLIPPAKKDISSADAYSRLFNMDDWKNQYPRILTKIQNLNEGHQEKLIPRVSKLLATPLTAEDGCIRSDCQIDSLLHPFTKDDYDHLMKELAL